MSNELKGINSLLLLLKIFEKLRFKKLINYQNFQCNDNII